MVEAIARYTCNACEGKGESAMDRIPVGWISIQVTGRGKHTDGGMVDHYAHLCPECLKYVREAVPQPQGAG